jgi:hypothetical protein
MLNVPLVFLPRGKKFDLVLKDALEKGRVTLALRAEINDKTIRFVYFAELVLLGLVVFLMVFKPF